MLGLIGISYKTSFKPPAGARDRRQSGADHAAGERLGGNHDLSCADNAAAEFFDFIFYFFIHRKIHIGEAAP